MAYILDLPEGFAHVLLKFGGAAMRYPAAVTYGVNVDEYGATPTAAATFIADLWADNLVPLLSNDVSILGCLIKFGPLEDGPSAEVADIRAGGVSDDPSSSAACILVRKQTALGGKRHHGRMYFPGPREGTLTDGYTLTSPTVTAWQTAMTTVYAAHASSQLPIYLLHRTREPGTLGPNDPGSVAPIPTHVEGLTVQQVIATQRRRLRR